MRRRSSNPTSERADLVLTVAVAICLAPPAVRAQDAPARIVADVSDCVGVKSPDERLACFDRHVEAAKPNRDASPAPQTSAAAAPPAAHTDTVAGTPTSAYAPAAQAHAPPAQAAAAAPSTASAPVAAAPVAAVSATAATAAATALPPQPVAPQRDAQTNPAEIVATVTELHETVPNAWLITLDNGQVWRQNTPQRFALKTGQRVTLRTTKWGASYRLSADTLNGFIQVERVR
jgi:hypothetical protein